MLEPGKLLYSRPEAAQACGMSLRSIDYLISSEELPVVRFGKRGVRIDAEDLRSWIRESKYKGRRRVSV